MNTSVSPVSTQAGFHVETPGKIYQVGIYLFKVNNKCQWRRFGVFIVNFEHIPHLVLAFLLLTLSM